MNTTSRIESDDNTSSRSKQSLRLWLRLFSCQALVEDKIRALLRDNYGITLPQFDVLAELEHAGRALTMTELSKYLVVSNGNITGVVDRLEREDYLTRIRSDEDRRVQYIELTSQGKKRFKKIAIDHEKWVSDIFADLSQDQISELISLLKTTKDSIKQQKNT